jgi:phage recombination protein Bet
MSENKELTKREDSVMEYVPFGSQDKVKLTIGIIKSMVAVKTRSGKTCSDVEAIKFMAMCQARRLNPFEGDAFLIGYDGKEGPTFSLITAHQAFLKRAEVNPEYDGMESGIIVRPKEGTTTEDVKGDFYDSATHDVVGGWATVFFKNRTHPMHKRIRLERFQKQFGIWQEDPAGMICKCAEADALRSSFPTMLGGLFLQAELGNDAPKVSAPLFQPPVRPEMREADDGPAYEKEPATGQQEAPAAVVEEELKPLPGTQTDRLEGLFESKGVGIWELLQYINTLHLQKERFLSLKDLVGKHNEILVMLESEIDNVVSDIKGKRKS